MKTENVKKLINLVCVIILVFGIVFCIMSLTENLGKSQEVINYRVMGSLEITKVDQDANQLIEGVKFNILDSKKKVIATVITDKDGKATVKDLVKGTYYYQEVEVPDGYVKDEEIFEFQINELNEVVKREVINYRVMGSLEITKVDEDTKQPIEGVKFNILDSKKKLITTVTTDKDGKATVKDLVKGTYYYQEIDAPVYYEFSDKKVKFQINANNEVIKQTVTNKKVTGTIQITKIDNNNNPIKGAKFEILDANHKKVAAITTDSNGVAKTKDLVLGKYYYREISALDKYIVDSKEKDFTLGENANVFEVTVYNEPKTLAVTE